MFKNIKEKAVNLKDSAKNKIDNIDLLDIKESINNSASGVKSTVEKSKSGVKISIRQSKASIDNAVENTSKIAGDMSRQSKEIITSGVKSSVEMSKSGIKTSIEQSKSSIDNAVESTSKTVGEMSRQSKEIIASGKGYTNEAIDKNWPIIEETLVKGLIGVAEEKLQDEEFLRSTFENVYELLPTPVRLIIGRDSFINFCIGQKNPILNRIDSYNNKNVTSEVL